jgi:hypothetical protein
LHTAISGGERGGGNTRAATDWCPFPGEGMLAQKKLGKERDLNTSLIMHFLLSLFLLK